MAALKVVFERFGRWARFDQKGGPIHLRVRHQIVRGDTMHIGHISGATRNLAAPSDWDKATNGPCLGLPIRDERTSAGKVMVSAWFPTSEEIERIQAGAPIYLGVYGSAHPPVSMSVGPRPGFEG